MAHIILLSAAIGAGKTTACARAIDCARRDGLRVGGLLAPADLDEHGARRGIRVRDLQSDATRPLATVAPQPDGRPAGRFAFDASAMAWARERLLEALAQPLDAVLIDEIGPLELVRGEGLAPCLPHIAPSPARAVVIVVREAYRQPLAERLAAGPLETITLDERSRDEAPERLYRALQAAIARPQ